jgi:hypothetical protein
MGKRFSVVFDERNTDRIEAMASRLRVQPDGLLLHFLLEKLAEVEGITTKPKKENINGQKAN